VGLFDVFSTKKRFDNRLKRSREELYSIMRDETQYRFNKGIVDNKVLMNPETAFTRTLLENSKWNAGIPEELEWFFKHTYQKLIAYRTDKIANSYFWNKVTHKTIRVHSGVPALISRTMVNLIAAPGFDVAVAIDNGQTDMDESEDETKRLEEIFEDNNFEDVLFPNGVNAESYGGYFAYKISYDKEISEFPIIELSIPECTEIVTKRGRKKAYIFKTDYEVKGRHFEIHEVYTKDEQGNAIIFYKKYEYKEGTLEERDFNSDEVKEYQDLTLEGLHTIPAVFKNNTTTNTQFKTSVYGLSDYTNSQSIFQAIDETMSQQMTALRFARPKRLISEDMLQVTATGQVNQFNDFETDFDIVKGDPDVETGKYQSFADKMDIANYTDTTKSLMVNALNNAGLNPASAGLVGLEALNVSDDSARGKEKTSLRTREMKLKLWRKAIEELAIKVLQFDDVVVKGIEAQEYEVAVTFDDYSVPSLDQRITTAGKAMNEGLVDVSKAIDMVWKDDMTDEQKEEMILNIKLENEVPLTPTDNVEGVVDEEPEAT